MKKVSSDKRIKSLFCIILAFWMVLSFCACGKDDRIGSIEDLNGKNITFRMGYSYGDVIQSDPRLAGANIMFSANHADEIGFLLTGKADAIALDRAVAEQEVNNNEDLMLLDETIGDSYYGIAFPKNSDLIREFDYAITLLQNRGTLSEIERKWTIGPDEEKIPAEQDWIGKNGTIVCSFGTGFEPVSYEDEDGNILGIDVDVALAIGQLLDYNIEFKKIAFEDVLPSVMSAQVDFGMAGLTITEDRQRFIDFSNPYMKTCICFIIKDPDAKSSIGDFLYSIKIGTEKMLEGDRPKRILDSMGMSLFLILSTMFFGGILGYMLFLCYYHKRKFAVKIISAFQTFLTYNSFFNWLMIVYYILFAWCNISNVTASIIALSVSFAYSVSNALCSSIDELGTGQREAALTMGYSDTKLLYKILFPQALPDFLSKMQDASIDMIKTTVLVEFIAVAEIITVTDAIRVETNEPFMPIVLSGVFLIIIEILISRILEFIKNKTDRSARTEEAITKAILEGKL